MKKHCFLVFTLITALYGYAQNVGIGHPTPFSPLHVRANGGAGGVLPFFSTATFESNTNTLVSLLSPDANNAGIVFGLNSNNVSGSIVYNNPATAKGFQFRTRNNVLQMVLDSLGKLGVGTASPTDKLEVKNPLRSTVRISSSSTIDTTELVLSNKHISGVFTEFSIKSVREQGLFFSSASDITANNSANSLVITPDGNVGVGIIPASRFHVSGNTQLNGATNLNGPAGMQGLNLFEFGIGVAGKEISAGKIGYNAFGRNALTFVGAGTNSTNRSIYFYAEGGTGINGNLFIEDPVTGFRRVDIKRSETGTDGGEILLYNAAGAVTIELDADYGDGDGRVITRELQITGGADLAEHFVVNKTETAEARPGMLVSIDENKEGRLVVTSKALDKKVVGIISGANGIQPGMMMGQKGTLADGEYPVALTGRVYVLTNKEGGEIHPGDFLTSSAQRGYARKVTDFKKSQGAVIGKAMGKADPVTGYVLVLVNLQ